MVVVVAVVVVKTSVEVVTAVVAAAVVGDRAGVAETTLLPSHPRCFGSVVSRRLVLLHLLAPPPSSLAPPSPSAPSAGRSISQLSLASS